MPKGAIRIRKSKKDRYSICQKDKDKEKMPSKNLQNTSQKTKDRAILSPHDRKNGQIYDKMFN
jgi:hypothetical protein